MIQGCTNEPNTIVRILLGNHLVWNYRIIGYHFLFSIEFRKLPLNILNLRLIDLSVVVTERCCAKELPLELIPTRSLSYSMRYSLFQCPACQVEFNESMSLCVHLCGHVSRRAAGVLCVFCQSMFDTEAELSEHLKCSHPVDTKSPELFTYACLICEVRSLSH